MTLISPSRRRRLPLLATAAAMVGLVATSLPASGQTEDPFAGLPAWDEYGFQGEGEARIQNHDAREGVIAPTEDQLRAAEALGATAARFNAFGTPKVLMNHTGTLAGPREGDAVEVARDFVRDNAGLFRLDAARVDALEVLRDAPLRESADLRRMAQGQAPSAGDEVAHAVMFRQRFGDLPAGRDGLLTAGVKADGSVVYVTSSVTGDSAVTGAQELDAAAAVATAAKDVEMELGSLTAVTTDDERFTTFSSDVVGDVQRARLVALPTPQDGVRRAWEVTLLDSALDEHGNPTAFISFVDAETGKVWQRENKVEHFAHGAGAPTASSMSVGRATQEGPSSPAQWTVFPANPPFVHNADTSDDSTDTRLLWCWDNLSNPAECDEQQMNPASPRPWDQTGNRVTFTTDGNNASTAISEASFLTPDTAANRPVSPDRQYNYPWKNAWYENSCNPATFGPSDSFVTGGPNDEAASTANLFVGHNRMHDWSYYLGFTEENFNMQQEAAAGQGGRHGDPELGSSQAGRRTFNGRDNANQITLQDGVAPITNQYLWQPLAGAFYAPCVDGAYDMAVVAHEYGHAITNRMIAGPDGGTGGSQGQTESWSDLIFAAYFQEFAISSGEGVDPLVLGPYVTGNDDSGIRNYGMNRSPLTYGELEYDGNGLTSPHANGEIWSATNYDIFSSLQRKYDGTHPSSDAELQRSCARGEKDAKDCPGNRRWNQIQFDSFLLMPQDASMVDSRDAMLAADMMRFGGENQNELWNAFAKRGLGLGANSFEAGEDDLDAIAAYDSPLVSSEALVTFRAPGGVQDMEVFVGHYEARATPIADTIAATPLDETASFIPGTYDLIARAPGHGVQRFQLTMALGEKRAIEVPMRRNHASAANGGEVLDISDGVNLQRIIDDTEDTNWASLADDSDGNPEGAQVEGRQVTVDLEGDAAVNVSEVQVSAALNGGCAQDVPIFGDCEDENDEPSEDPGTQNRFSALRSFDILTCDATTGADCTTDAGFTPVFASPDDAFPAARPRPKVPDLITRGFDVPDTLATHVRLVVRDNQCTGGPDFQAETNPDNDPAFNPDCDTETSTPDRAVLKPPKDIVRAAELQVFSSMPAAPREVGPTTLTPEARAMTSACPEGDGGVPRDSRQDDNGNIHEFAIDCMVWYEIAKGTTDTQYEPRLPVSRAQMASFVARLIEESGGQLPEGDDAFGDDNGNTHEENINKLAAAGIVDGKAEGVYDPLGTVSRGQMAKFLVGAYQYRSGILLEGNGDYFVDDDGTTHEANINRSAAAGFTAGRNGGYEPGAEVLRDQMASFLARTLDLLVEEGTAQAKNAQG